MSQARSSVAALSLALAGCAAAASAGEIQGARIVVEVAAETPGSDPQAPAPPRFVLLEDGQVFVGGTGQVQWGQLEKSEAQALRRGADAARKAAGHGGRLAFDGEGRPVLLRLPQERQNGEIAISGDPARGAGPLREAADFVTRVLRFDHPSLARYEPVSYAASAREERLPGGCRSWSFGFPIEQAVAGPRVVTAAEAEGWPTGAWPASVCSGDKRYVVHLRPLLPGEQP